MIVEPVDGETVFERAILVRGLARPGSTITRDIPMWFDEHTTADAIGHWTFAIVLNEGENVLTFRVGDDTSTEVTLVVNYRSS